MRRDRCALFLALALSTFASGAFAQDAGVPPAAPDPHAQTAPSPGPVDPNAPLPPGHPPMNGGGDANGGGDPHGGSIRRAQLPESAASEDPSLPRGVMVVRMIDPRGNPVPDASVRVGSMREGESAGAQEIRTGPDGVARIEGLSTDGSVAYRVSAEHEGARFGAPPFQMGAAGYRVQLVRFDVSHTPRAMLLWDTRAEIRFKDDRAVVVVRAKLVNLTALSLGESAAQPVTFVPTDGLRFTLPQPHTAFVTQPSMSDVHLTEEGNAAVFRGSVPPTTGEPTDVVFQYQVKLEGGDVDLAMGLPLPVVSASVVTEAPPGLTLSVAGMPAPETREVEGQRILITGLERRPDDPPLSELRVHLGGIPRASGPLREGAAALATLITLGAVGYGLSRRRAMGEKRSRTELEAERARVLDEMTELARLRDAGEVGPVTYERRRRELSLWLASLLKELDAAPAA